MKTANSRKPLKSTLRRAHHAAARESKNAENQYIVALRRVVGKMAKKYADRALALHAAEVSFGGMRKDSASFVDPEFDDIDDEVADELEAEVYAAFDRMSRQILASTARVARNQGLAIDLRKTHGHIVTPARQRQLLLIDKAMKGYGDRVRAVFDDPEVYGMSPRDLAKKIQAATDITKNQATLIARDQTLKLNAAVTRERQISAGVSRYIWSTSMDDRVRPEHEDHEGKVFSWDVPPRDTGHPGDDINCRCQPLPILPSEEEPDDE